MAVQPLRATDSYAALTAAKAADETEGHRTMALVRLLVLVAGVLFLSALGVSVAASLTQPFARALVVAALALPVAAMIALIARGWAALARPQLPARAGARPRRPS